MIIIEIHTLLPVAISTIVPIVAIVAVSRNINLHALWPSHYIRPMVILIQSLKSQYTCPVAILT